MVVSCEGMRFADGYVYDKTTNDPIDSVLCVVLENGSEVYTDSTGHYYIDGPFGGCLSECKDMTVEYSKLGFQTQTILNPERDYIYLEK